MPKFLYEVKKSPTEIVKGVLVADTKNAAIQKMDRLGYCVVSIDEEGVVSTDTVDKKPRFFDRVNLKNVTNFTRQLSDLLESGLTIVKALDILRNQTENKRLKNIIADIQDFCIGGNPLSSALARHPKVFSDLFVSMVRSGETGGALENILKRLSEFNKKQLDIQTKIRTALAYPILMSVVGCATIIVLLTFVMPKMMVMFGDLGQALPLPTQILLGISYIITNYWWVVIVAFFLITMSVMKIYKTEEGRLAIDRLKLKLPLVNQLIMKIEIARFSRTLATLLNNGVPILESLRVVSGTVKNAVIRQEIAKAYTAVREGSSLAKGFYNSKVMPMAMVNMIAIGEEGGHLEKSLFKIAEASEEESDEAIKIVMSLLEPIMILVLGVIVGFIVISMLLPIFEINFLMR